jgi:hypothetical protein
MAGSAADTPATPESVRASDAERDHAIDELRQEFVEGRLSHQTFMFRVQTALGARHRGQLARLFTDLPPRQARSFNPAELLARTRALFRHREPNATDPAAKWSGEPPPPLPGFAPFGVPGPGSWGPGACGELGAPAPLVFPPGSGTCFTIGRTQECDLRIADMSVSRLHAQLARDQDGWLLSDLGSHNGTRVNGWLVREPVPVRAGDVLQFGSATFVIRDDAAGQAPSG